MKRFEFCGNLGLKPDREASAYRIKQGSLESILGKKERGTYLRTVSYVENSGIGKKTLFGTSISVFLVFYRINALDSIKISIPFLSEK